MLDSDSLGNFSKESGNTKDKVLIVQKQFDLISHLISDDMGEHYEAHVKSIL